MSIAKKIKSVLLHRDMTIKELSDKLGYDGSYLYNKLSRNRFTEEELIKIAKILNCKYEAAFYDLETGDKL